MALIVLIFSDPFSNPHYFYPRRLLYDTLGCFQSCQMLIWSQLPCFFCGLDLSSELAEVTQCKFPLVIKPAELSWTVGGCETCASCSMLASFPFSISSLSSEFFKALLKTWVEMFLPGSQGCALNELSGCALNELDIKYWSEKLGPSCLTFSMICLPQISAADGEVSRVLTNADEDLSESGVWD